jgi:hypothetical protein
MPRKKSALDNLSQTHGKVEKAITLDQVWGNDGKAKYGTLDVEEYDNYLKGLVKSDLQSPAVKIGLVPVDNRETLVKRLKQEFVKYVSQFKGRPSINNAKKLSKEVKNILAEGR